MINPLGIIVDDRIYQESSGLKAFIRHNGAFCKECGGNESEKIGCDFPIVSLRTQLPSSELGTQNTD